MRRNPPVTPRSKDEYEFNYDFIVGDLPDHIRTIAMNAAVDYVRVNASAKVRSGRVFVATNVLAIDFVNSRKIKQAPALYRVRACVAAAAFANWVAARNIDALPD